MFDYSYLLKAEWGCGCFAEDYLLLIGIVANLKPQTILEIGTHSGLGAVVLAHAASQWHKDPRVTTVDVTQKLGRSNLHLIPHVDRYIEFIEGHSDNVLRSFHEQGRTFDLVFVDGAHDYYQASQDWVNSQDLTSTWVLHDTTQFTGLQRLVREIRATYRYEVFQFITAPGHRKEKKVGETLLHKHFTTGLTLVQQLSNLDVLFRQAHRGDTGKLLPGHFD